jgi:hypothetical protein
MAASFPVQLESVGMNSFDAKNDGKSAAAIDLLNPL